MMATVSQAYNAYPTKVSIFKVNNLNIQSMRTGQLSANADV